MRAALEGLADVGYDSLSMAEIASRASVGKGALYRRWTSKAQLVTDAMVRGREQVRPVLAARHRSLHGDLEAMVAQVPDFDEAANGKRASPGARRRGDADAGLRQALAGPGLEQPRRAVVDVLGEPCLEARSRPMSTWG